MQISRSNFEVKFSLLSSPIGDHLAGALVRFPPPSFTSFDVSVSSRWNGYDSVEKWPCLNLNGNNLSESQGHHST